MDIDNDNDSRNQVELDEALAKRMQELEINYHLQQPVFLNNQQSALLQQGVPFYEGFDAPGLHTINYNGGASFPHALPANSYGALNSFPDVYISDDERNLMATYSLGKGIKLLAVIDGALLVINSCFVPFFGFISVGTNVRMDIRR